MKCSPLLLSVFAALAAVLCAADRSSADGRIRTGARTGIRAEIRTGAAKGRLVRKPGAVRFNIGGGAGDAPRFHVGGTHSGRFKSADGVGHRLGRRLPFVGGSTVAVGPGGLGGGYFGDGGFANLYTQGFIPVPPYFSLHPPVYYSQPVARTYGYSPFAYPGTFQTPEVVMQPEEIVNPYVEPIDPPEPQEASAKTASSRSSTGTTTEPQVIHNPFVVTGRTASRSPAVQ